MLYNHKPWHGTCPKEIHLWGEKEGAEMGALAKQEIKAEALGSELERRKCKIII